MHNLQQAKDIYKFVSIESAKKIIEFQSLKFSQPYEFNDPFDCDIDLVDFEFNDSLTDTVKEEIEKLKSQYPNPNSPLMDPKSDMCILKGVLRDICAQNIILGTIGKIPFAHARIKMNIIQFLNNKFFSKAFFTIK